MGDLYFNQIATPIKLAITLGAMALIPFLLLALTSFTRIIIVFSLLRSALATRTVPPDQVLIGLSLFLTFYIMRPTLTEVYNKAVLPYVNNKITTKEAIFLGSEPLRKFMLKYTGEQELSLFVHFSGQPKPNTIRDVPTSTIIPAYITSELKRAFQMSFLIYLPFLIIDMALASVLLSMGMFMLPPMMVSVPLKLLLFVLVDGWNLTVGSLVESFH